MQLVAYGAQDIYLTGNPTITYFKVVYRRHTNFAMESIQQTYSGMPGFGRTISALLSRNGDLIHGLLLEITVPALTNGAWIHDVGNFLLKQVDIEIGGQLIDRHYADWLEMWSQLTVSSDKRLGYNAMIGQGLVSSTGAYLGLQANGNHDRQTLMVPLQFWFCRNVGLALPLIALQYHEVKLNITFANLSDVIARGTTTGDLTCDIFADYIYLDTDERRRFAQVSHEYLIEQVQFNGDEPYGENSNVINYPLSFNHPVKELIWACKETNNVNNVNTRQATFVIGANNDFVTRINKFNNSLYYCGYSNSLTLNGINRNPEVNTFHGFISKLDENNNLIWHKWMNGIRSELYDVHVDGEGNVYTYGLTRATANQTSVIINNVNYTPPALISGNQDAFIVKLSPDGNVIWFKWICGTLNDKTSGDFSGKFSIDNTNNVYFAVQTNSTTLTLVHLAAVGTEVLPRFDTTATNFGIMGSVVYKLSKEGNFVWSANIMNGNAHDCIVSSNGSLVVNGRKVSANNVQTANNIKMIVTDNNNNILLDVTFVIGVAPWCLNLNPNGTACNWFRSFNGLDSITTSATDNNDNTIVCGYLPANINTITIRDIDGNQIGNQLTLKGVNRGFYCKLNNLGQLVFNSYINSKINDVACDADDNILFTIFKENAANLTLTTEDNTILYTYNGTLNFTHIISVSRINGFIYSKEANSTGSFPTLFISTDSVYFIDALNRAPFAVINSDGTTETYPYTRANVDSVIYNYTFTLNNVPDPYSIGTSSTGCDNFAVYSGGVNPVAGAQLLLNGNERFTTMNGDYFNLLQCNKHHTCIPKSPGINVYSFAIKPEEHQPSGTCNFSRIDNSQLRINFRPDLTGGVMKLYALNYNVLRVMSGMAGLAYSN